MNTTTKMLELLTKLAAILPRRSGSDTEIKLFLETFLEELEPYTSTQLSVAIAKGRKEWKWFPTIPELLTALRSTKKTKDDTFHRAGPQFARGVSEKARAAWFEICDTFDEDSPGTAVSWFYPLTLQEPEPGHIKLTAPGSGWVRNWIGSHYFTDLQSSFQQRGFNLRAVT